ncbi:MAG: hypothetical protein UZ03_NOB001003650 [Nitrospira sp. OLB3]|nr:MAG: hypothetical protein UZ03_NOB001003650 [Nitrospira sp. OLB3]
MIPLPQSCERALLERFLRAEAMALAAVRSAQAYNLPRHVQTFLQRHELDEQDHLRRFESLLGTTSLRSDSLPGVPSQWEALAVYLFGYEAWGWNSPGSWRNSGLTSPRSWRTNWSTSGSSRESLRS